MAPGIGMSTFFVGRERCRLPEGLELAGLARRLNALQGSVSLRTARGFLISSAEGRRGPPSEEDVVEVRDYDPVRHSCLAIGLREPGLDTPIHWMAYRTDELARAAAFVWDAGGRDGVEYVTKRHPPGSFQEALEIVGLAGRSGRPAGAVGRGYLVRAPSARELESKFRGPGHGPGMEAGD
jgi:hypothetical protein